MSELITLENVECTDCDYVFKNDCRFNSPEIVLEHVSIGISGVTEEHSYSKQLESRFPEAIGPCGDYRHTYIVLAISPEGVPQIEVPREECIGDIKHKDKE